VNAAIKGRAMNAKSKKVSGATSTKIRVDIVQANEKRQRQSEYYWQQESSHANAQ
jgi:hypothetical protein